MFAFDSGTDYADLVTHVAWDHAETGVLCAQWVADYANENLGGKVRVGVLAMLNAVHTQVRSEAFVEELERLMGAENITWVFNQDFGETRESAANIVTNNIMKPIDVIWAPVDNAAIGATTALEQNAATGHHRRLCGRLGRRAVRPHQRGQPLLQDVHRRLRGQHR